MDVLQSLISIMEWIMQPATINAVGFIVVIAYAMHNASKHSLNPMIMYWSAVWAVAGAFLGGRILVLIIDPPDITHSISTLSLLMEGGRSVMGAFIGAILMGGIYLKYKKVVALNYIDIAAPAVALGYVFARIGCFVNGDDFGVLSDLPWATHFYSGTEIYSVHLQRGWISQGATASLSVHPVQLYHALVGLTGFFIFKNWETKWHGSCFIFAMAYYGVARFVIQYYRDDHWISGALIDNAQWVSLLLIGAAIVLWAIHNGNERMKVAVIGQ